MVKRRHVLGSLLGITLFSGAVVAEAEHNYATVTALTETHARVEWARADDGGLQVRLAAHNSMNEPLRVQYVHLEIDHADGIDSASVPYNGIRSLPPGDSTLSPSIPERKITGQLEAGDSITVSGGVAVDVYNEYRFEIPIEPQEVEL